MVEGCACCAVRPVGREADAAFELGRCVGRFRWFVCQARLLGSSECRDRAVGALTAAQGLLPRFEPGARDGARCCEALAREVRDEFDRLYYAEDLDTLRANLGRLAREDDPAGVMNAAREEFLAPADRRVERLDAAVRAAVGEWGPAFRLGRLPDELIHPRDVQRGVGRVEPAEPVNDWSDVDPFAVPVACPGPAVAAAHPGADADESGPDDSYSAACPPVHVDGHVVECGELPPGVGTAGEVRASWAGVFGRELEAGTGGDGGWTSGSPAARRAAYAALLDQAVAPDPLAPVFVCRPEEKVLTFDGFAVAFGQARDVFDIARALGEARGQFVSYGALLRATGGRDHRDYYGALQKNVGRVRQRLEGAPVEVVAGVQSYAIRRRPAAGRSSRVG